MDGSTPKEILVHTKQYDQTLQDGVHGQLVDGGHYVRPQDLDPNDQSPLEEVNRSLKDLGHVAITTIGESLGPEVNYTRGTGGKNWLRTIKDRVIGRSRLSQSKKAA